MRGDSQVEGRVADPEVEESFAGYCFGHGVEDVLVGEGTVRELLLLLELGLGIVEGQTEEGGEESRKHACPE